MSIVNSLPNYASISRSPFDFEPRRPEARGGSALRNRMAAPERKLRADQTEAAADVRFPARGLLIASTVAQSP